jgi:hypothetical protein
LNDEIMRATDRRPMSKQEKQLIRAKEVVRAEVQLKAFQADGAVALGRRLMRGAVELDADRRELAGDDVSLHIQLAEIQARALRQVGSIQASLYNDWGL